MSSVQVAMLPGAAGPPAVARPEAEERGERVGVRGAAFLALGLYGISRWDTLLAGGLGRLCGLLALSTALAVAGPLAARFSRWLAVALFLVGILAGLAIAGLPAEWVTHLRVAVSARYIGTGLSALPQINVPYLGINQSVRLTLMLGAMVLLLDAAVVLTFVPRRLGLLRRAGAALPLMALSVIPATVLRPRSSYLEGALLFALIVIFLWGERIQSQRLGGVLGPCVVAVALAVGLAPALDAHGAWVSYRQLASSLAPTGVERFNWSQGYGPLSWPQSGRAVMEVQASRPEYWKAENLDVFDGRGWVEEARPPVRVPWQTGVSSGSLRRWTQTIQVTVDSMETNNVIAAGSAYPPTSLSGKPLPGGSPGTWQSSRQLSPGASYRVRVYVPQPSPAQLAGAGTSYPSAITSGYLSMVVPETPGLSGAAAIRWPGVGLPEQVVFPPFNSHTSPPVESASAVASALTESPYAQVFALAQRLKAGAPTPCDFVRRVESYLSHGYRYSQTPPPSRYPLESFLFVNKLGYCQHFAGAMALLLRMGGVPARVSVGFTEGVFDTATHRWVVSDLGAHAWVEAWFPSYGWVRFDPTPGVDPALSENTAAPGSSSGSAKAAIPRLQHREIGGSSTPAAQARAPRAGHSSGVSALVIAPAAGLALLLLLLLMRTGSRGDPVGELVRAYRRTGRPLTTTTTLSRLEGRLAHSPDAEAYIRALRLARFGPGSGAASAQMAISGLSPAGRRALRKALGNGLGVVGRVRAWWALPPRWSWPGRQ